MMQIEAEEGISVQSLLSVVEANIADALLSLVVYSPGTISLKWWAVMIAILNSNMSQECFGDVRLGGVLRKSSNDNKSMSQANPWKEQRATGATGLKNRFEDLAKPEPKPTIIRGKTTWANNGNSGDWHGQGKFDKSHKKPKKSDFGPAPSLTDLP